MRCSSKVWKQSVVLLKFCFVFGRRAQFFHGIVSIYWTWRCIELLEKKKKKSFMKWSKVPDSIKEFDCRCSHIFEIFSYLTSLARLSLVTVNERPGNVSSTAADWL